MSQPQSTVLSDVTRVTVVWTFLLFPLVTACFIGTWPYSSYLMRERAYHRLTKPYKVEFSFTTSIERDGKRVQVTHPLLVSLSRAYRKEFGRFRYLFPVESVSFFGESPQDASLLRCFPEIRTIRLSSVKNVDEVLARVSQLPNLQRVEIRDCDSLTHKGIAHLGNARHLVNLEIIRCDITGTGFSKWRTPVLQVLRFDGCPLTDDSVWSLKGLTNLRVLGLRQSRISWVRNTKKLGLFSHLEELDLTGSSLCVDGFFDMADEGAFSNLRVLKISSRMMRNDGAQWRMLWEDLPEPIRLLRLEELSFEKGLLTDPDSRNTVLEFIEAQPRLKTFNYPKLLDKPLRLQER